MPSSAIIGTITDGVLATKIFEAVFDPCDLYESNKIIVLIDDSYVEIIFTNEILSVSCFVKNPWEKVDSSFFCEKVNSPFFCQKANKFKVHLAGISHQHLRCGKNYDVRCLGFYSERKSHRLTKLEPLIALQLPHFLFDFSIKRIPTALKEIYLLFEGFLAEGMKKFLEVVPLSLLEFDVDIVSDNSDIGNNSEIITCEKINVYKFDTEEIIIEDYSFLNISSIQD